MNVTERIEETYDVVVVGGGMSGVCAAIAAARNGARTALLQDRSVLGGNASSEVRMHICGASSQGKHQNARETGIIEEILLENKFRNPTHSFYMFDRILWEKVRYQEGLDLFLNTSMHDAEMDGKRIVAVLARQTVTEKRFRFAAPVFIDCSGDGLLSAQAGASFMWGREGRDVFLEPGAVQQSDRVTMGNSILFHAIDAGKPVPFERPEWAYNYRDAEWIQKINFVEIDSGYWWLEVGGTKLDIIKDHDAIHEELLKIVYGVWDYFKACLNPRADNLVLDWVGNIAAKRESRRVIGDYILKEQDLLASRVFEDAVAYGGWHIDVHQPERFYTERVQGLPEKDEISVHLPDLYSIPYRSLYSADIDNLLLGGRIISTSHRAFGSTRVMGTCAVVGQAIGTSAAMAAASGRLPRDMGGRMAELQQRLLKDDCYIPGAANADPNDWARSAQVTASSAQPGSAAENVISGVTRTVKEDSHQWISEPLAGGEQWIALSWERPVRLTELRFTFDSKLSTEIMPSLSKWIQNRQDPNVPDTLAEEYEVELLLEGVSVWKLQVTGNYQRHRIHAVEGLVCDQAKLTVRKTRGRDEARLYEIRAYGSAES